MLTESNSNQTVQEKVYNELRYNLMVGAFVPGQPISLRKLAAILETSLTPVREAVKRLTTERAFEILPNRTVIIPEMNEDKLTDLMYWRKKLEGKAAELACKNFTAKDIKKLEKINDELIEAVNQNELQLTLIKNQEFHFHIYKAHGSAILMPMIESLWLQCGPFIYYSKAAPQVAWNGSCHKQTIEAIKENDAKGVRKAIEQDIQEMSDFLINSHLLKKAFPRAILSS